MQVLEEALQSATRENFSAIRCFLGWEGESPSGA